MTSGDRNLERWVREHGRFAVILLAALGLVHSRLFDADAVLASRNSRFVSEHLGTQWLAFAAHALGRPLPGWRFDLRSGGAALADPNALLDHPLLFLFHWLPPERALGPTIALHLLLVGCGYYLLGATLRLGLWPRVLLALSGTFNYKLLLALESGWLPLWPLLVALPYLIGATFAILREATLRSMLYFAGSVALAAYSGQAQIGYYAALFIAVLWVLSAIGHLAARRFAAARDELLCFFAGGTLGLGLAAPRLLPAWFEHTLLDTGKMDYRALLNGHAVGPATLRSLIWPGGIAAEDCSYFGLLAFGFLAAGAIWARRDRRARFLLCGFVFSLVLGMDTPILEFAHAHLPGFDQFQNPTRLLFLTTLFALALAGFGFQALLSRIERAPIRLALVVPLIVFTLSEAWYHAEQRLEYRTPSEVRPAISLALPATPPALPYRIVALGPSALNGAWAAPLGLELIGGAPRYTHYRRYLELLEKPGAARPDLLDALAVRFVVSDAPQAGNTPLQQLADQPRFELGTGFTRGALYLYENKSALPRASFPERVIRSPDADATFAALSRGALKKRALLESTTATTAGPRSLVRSYVQEADGFSLHVFAERAGTLVVSEVWHPGWQATIGDEPLAIERANGALIGVLVPAGEHTLRFRFETPGRTAGLGIGALALLLASTGVYFAFRAPRLPVRRVR